MNPSIPTNSSNGHIMNNQQGHVSRTKKPGEKEQLKLTSIRQDEAQHCNKLPCWLIIHECSVFEDCSMPWFLPRNDNGSPQSYSTPVFVRCVRFNVFRCICFSCTGTSTSYGVLYQNQEQQLQRARDEKNLPRRPNRSQSYFFCSDVLYWSTGNEVSAHSVYFEYCTPLHV